MALYGEHQTIEGIVELHASTIPLVFGREYQGRMIVNAVKQLTSVSDVAALIEDLGFSDVRIYMDASALPPDWPQSKRTGPSGVDQFTAWFDAIWDASSAQEMSRPSYILDIWYVDETTAGLGTPATKVVALGRHGKARQLVLGAWVKVHGPESVPTLAAVQVIQSVGLHESGYGTLIGENNVGGIQAGRIPADGVVPPGTFIHGDKDAQGVGYKVLFRAYPTLLDGWVDLVRHLTIYKPKVAAVIDSPNVRDVAQAMYASGYYAGDATNGKNPVDGYAAALQRGVVAIAKELGEPLAADAPGASSSAFRGLIALLALGAGVYWAVHHGSV
jgi:hypothetical protein